MSWLCKCVIWDLDNTVWDGINLEGQVLPRPGVIRAIETLRDRGILHSIASRGDEALALQTLEDHQLRQYFNAPKINWLPKSTNILEIMRTLNLSPDAAAFVDDEAFEREQVAYMIPGVHVVAAEVAAGIPDLPGFDSGPLTSEAKNRGRLYEEEEARKAAERSFSSREDFLLSCDMRLTVRCADPADVPRIIELMRRTHQMNSSGLLLNKTDLDRLLTDSSEHRRMYVADLRDRFGFSGIISAAMTETLGAEWYLRLFAMSCRVMGRGVERAILSALIGEALNRGCERVAASYNATERNSMMRTMFQMSGFRRHEESADGSILYLLDYSRKPTCPSWVSVL